MSTNDRKFITKEGMKKLKQELQDRMSKERKKIADKLDHAKSMGDLSENSAYHAALEDYQLNETRIKDLKRQIQMLDIAPDKSGDSSADIGDTIEVTDADGNAQTYTLVGEGEGDPLSGQLSVNSALGSAFVGKKVKDTVTVKLPAGEKRFTVTKVS